MKNSSAGRADLPSSEAVCTHRRVVDLHDTPHIHDRVVRPDFVQPRLDCVRLQDLHRKDFGNAGQ